MSLRKTIYISDDAELALKRLHKVTRNSASSLFSDAIVLGEHLVSKEVKKRTVLMEKINAILATAAKEQKKLKKKRKGKRA